YFCYRQILAGFGCEPIDIERYWKLKRAAVNRNEILKLSRAEGKYQEFLERWEMEIETDDALDLDKVQTGAREKLLSWKDEKISLILATMRKKETALLNQLERLKLHELFDEIIVCRHAEGSEGKASSVKNRISQKETDILLWVGDTEADVKAARILGCRVWALSCGLRNSDFLTALSPDFLSTFLNEIDLGRLKEFLK
ncbi:MAG TPA: HAD family hydrolase, partial [Pyrinomonadaceae bacterium]|nr:HAD family hydrolase [Pyrinomonadaceae bacterium]